MQSNKYMHLKKITVEGFKSIAKRTDIDLENDINIIMGPNGSGKSNIFECIEWALGGQSAKQLRAKNMEDIIFDGGQNGTEANFAEVILHFDNTDRAFDIDHDEVLISRKLVRNKGNNYYINNNNCKLRDINTLLENKGIGKNNYAITGQSKITEFIMAKPEETRQILEEAAGISGFKEKKREILRTLDNYDKDMEQFDSMLREIQRILTPLKKQVKDAEVYVEAKKELDEKSFIFYSNELKVNADIIKNLTQEQGVLEDSRQSLFSEKTEIELAAESFSNNTTNNKSKIQENESILSEQQTVATALEKELLSISANIENLNNKKKDLEIRLQESIVNADKENKEYESLLKEITLLEEQSTSFKNDISEITSQLIQTKQTTEILKQTTKALSDKKVDLMMLVQTKQALLDSTKKNLKNTLEQSLDDSHKNLLIKKQEIEVTNNKNQTSKTELTNAITELDKLLLKRDKLEKSLSFLEKSNSKSNKVAKTADLFKNVDGFIGIFKDLLTYDDKFDIAVQTLYNNVLFNFVVENSICANKCIDILKKNKIPPMNFIILESITETKKIFETDGAINSVSIFKYKQCYKKLVLNYLSNNFIAQTSELAEEVWNSLSRKNRVVSLDGNLYSGNILRGGHISKNPLLVKKEFEDILETIDKTLFISNVKFKNITEVKMTLNTTLVKAEHSEKELNNICFLIDKHEREISDKNIHINTQKEYIKSLVEEIQQTNSAKDEIVKEIATKLEELSQAELLFDDISNTKNELILNLEKTKTILDEKIKLRNSLESIETYSCEHIEQEISQLLAKVSELTTQHSFKKDNLSKIREDYAIKKIEHQDLLKLEESTRTNYENGLKRTNQIISAISEIDTKLSKIAYTLEKLTDKLRIANLKLDVIENKFEIAQEFSDKQNYAVLKTEVFALEKKIEKIGFVNLEAIEEFEENTQRYNTVKSNKEDLAKSKIKLLEILQTMQDNMLEKYLNCFNSVNQNLKNIFRDLFNGGNAELVMEEPDIPLESGVIIKATPPGKKDKVLSLLSGGERSLAAVAVIFSLLKFAPSPVVIFDEIDAALDEVKVSMLANYISEHKNVQYVIVSHRKPMLKIANILYGASMKNSETTLLSQKLNKQH